ncbi:DUF5643 domain-containing protein [Paenibacillus sp. 2TAF8]|jgi:hypothetical protein|uniref:DUF5643 domain-containing protein n=1 Tax=Paenibacillus sp. 2TAF8 TaxID=3233020 RepID=UPI003F9801C9
MKNTSKMIAVTALATGLLVGGGAWGYQVTTVDAAAAQATGEKGKAATASKAKTVRVTQSGITLEVKKAVFDGNLIDISIDRTSRGLENSFVYNGAGEGSNPMDEGSLESIDVYINGKSIMELGGKTLGQMPNLGWGPGDHSESVRVKITDASWLGDKGYVFPDKFQLKLKAKLAGVDKPYIVELPMQKAAAKPVVLKKNLIKQSGSITLEFGKISLTSASSRIQLIGKGDTTERLSRIQYEVVDDSGRSLDYLIGFGTDQNNKAKALYNDIVLTPIHGDAKSITIKPFYPEMEVPDAASGAFMLDANGEIVKNYIKDLEMEVPLK